MRKWMSERIKRRKKDPQEGKTEAAQAPLQPAYFDGEAVAKAVPSDRTQPPSGDNSQSERHEPQQTEHRTSQPAVAHVESIPREEIQSPDQRPGTSRPGNSASRQGRRRRGRGGRGRSGPRSVASKPAAGTSSDLPVTRDITEGQSGTQLAQAGVLAQSPAIPRVPKGVVVLAIGLPGSGKSSWFKRHNIAPLSSDLLRALLFDDPTEQRFQDLVFSNLRSLLKARLIARRPLNYVDATNLTSHDRRGWIKLAQDYGYEVQAVFFDVPLEVCLERNRKRERVVSEDVMRRMAAKQKPPTFDEGFSKITVVRVKQKE